MLAAKGHHHTDIASYGQALDEAPVRRMDRRTAQEGIDSATYRQRFTPRRRRSLWSARNVGIVRLIEEGRMRPRFPAEIDSAKADGRWMAYAGQATIQMPDDLAAALAETPSAQAMFDTQRPEPTCGPLRGPPRAPQTRRNRIDRLVAMLDAAKRHTPSE